MKELKRALGQLQNAMLSSQIDLDETGLWRAYLSVADAVKKLGKDGNVLCRCPLDPQDVTEEIPF